MTVEEALSQEAAMMGRDVILVDSAVLAGDVFVLVYDAESEPEPSSRGLGVLHQRRVALFTEDHTRSSTIVKTWWEDEKS